MVKEEPKKTNIHLNPIYAYPMSRTSNCNECKVDMITSYTESTLKGVWSRFFSVFQVNIAPCST